MIHLSPFLLFDGNCAEAMTFYRSCLEGELSLLKLGDTPMKASVPPEKHGRIVYAHLKSGAIEFSATDWLHAVRRPEVGNTVGMYLSGASYPELRAVFDALSAGAPKDTLDELRDMPFGAYGHLADKFGEQWFFRGEAGQGA